VQRLLRGAPGSSVSLTVEHPGSSSTAQVSVERAEIHQSAVGHAVLLANHVGYVTLRVFSDSSAHELKLAIDSLRRAGAKSLMLDLRGNPGGLLEQGVRVADLFLDQGERVVSTRGRTPESDTVYTDSTVQPWPTLPLAILVDDRTASAAELVAGALQDNDRAVILGSTTFGKGSAQTVFSLGSEGAVKLTTARWYTPLGRSISNVQADDDLSRLGMRPPPRPTFTTHEGRTVLGGGGITPDVRVGDTAIAPENMALMQALGRKVGNFRDALTSYALSVKASGSVTSPTFTVTTPMLDDVYARMVARGVDVPRMTYDEARPLVSRLLAYEIERYVFGAEAELHRKTMDDKVIGAALELLSGARTPHDALERARTMAEKTPAVELDRG
jgi:carboxyl-terminal processing protease